MCEVFGNRPRAKLLYYRSVSNLLWWRDSLATLSIPLKALVRYFRAKFGLGYGPEARGARATSLKASATRPYLWLWRSFHHIRALTNSFRPLHWHPLFWFSLCKHQREFFKSLPWVLPCNLILFRLDIMLCLPWIMFHLTRNIVRTPTI